MAKGIFNTTRYGLKYGRSNFANRRNGPASAAQITHDGDTLSVSTPANFGTRFLGIDSPEISYLFPGSRRFLGLGNDAWDEYFRSEELQEQLGRFSAPLTGYLRQAIGDGVDIAPEHYRHAVAAKKGLLAEIKKDMASAGRTKEDFEFFLAYGYEFLDGFGRLLCYLRPHRDNFPDGIPEASDVDYNLRQLLDGLSVPYFIFPNVDPFLRIFNTLDQQLIRPEGFWALMEQAKKLTEARMAVKAARTAGLGVFNPQDSVRLLPMELRFVARGGRPNRYVIDLGNPGQDTLLDPELYFTIKNVEDRMYIPANFGEYFQLCGWKLLRAETYARIAG